MKAYSLKRIHQEHLAKKGQIYTDDDGTQFIGTNKGRLEVYINTLGITNISTDLSSINTQLALLDPLDYKLKVDSTDSTSDFLSSKLTPGSNITFTILNPGANESIQVDASTAIPAGLGTEIQYNLAGVFASDSGFTRNPVVPSYSFINDDGAGNNTTFSSNFGTIDLSAGDTVNDFSNLQFTAAGINITSADAGSINSATIAITPISFFMSTTDSVSFAYTQWDISGGIQNGYLGTVNTAGLIMDNTNFSLINYGVTWLWPTTDGTTARSSFLKTDGSGTLSFGKIAVSDAEITAQTTNQTILTYTPLIEGMYRISCWSIINSTTATTLDLVVSYKDLHGTSISKNINLTTGAVTSPAVADTYHYSTFSIRTDPALANIVISTKKTGATINYDAGVSIEYL